MKKCNTDTYNKLIYDAALANDAVPTDHVIQNFCIKVTINSKMLQEKFHKVKIMFDKTSNNIRDYCKILKM
jgi:hypothetical protein